MCSIGAAVEEGRYRREKLRAPHSPLVALLLLPQTHSLVSTGMRRNRPLSQEASRTVHRRFLQAWAGVLCPGACLGCTQEVFRD